MHICIVFGYDLFCDLLEMLNFNKYRSGAVATCRNRSTVEENKRPVDSRTVRAFGLSTEGYRFEFRLSFFGELTNLTTKIITLLQFC
jgi:hypothetical protein